ncbi:ligase-associated DNA damage response endonuclease PdeM [Sphingomonas sp.]|uniref:ligase-associated DNA damage response endonuclease PdeM n=1 Tax=Sphingomonas sp. TaxID=28214 RepID=UPI003B0065AE
MVRFSFAGTELAALPGGVLWWPARAALIAADLHLEKASFLARFGQMLPPYDSEATLADLSALLVATQAREVWCLGDSFHDATGCERLSAAARETLRGMTSARRWTWIVGNHDARATALVDHCGGALVDEEEVDGLLLRHEARADERRPELSGHFHPKLRLTVKGRRVARRCFVMTEGKLILPAFGALTGGLDVDSPAIRRAIGPRPAQALVPLTDRLLRFPIAA